jgi:hypothetical protein
LRTRAWHRYVFRDAAPTAGSLSLVTLRHALRSRAWHRHVRENALGRGSFGSGDDAGGISTGGYASGLAAALVFGRVSAETVLS